ncbi:hypothetical protein [Neptunitalea lumnitzerae]|uniref:Uncharacterized protein n=1 Tax=Neptunitalea lumnitzerae TaxID=2965509 RepID=A0ABQ5MGN6_9FLAO|nr:hypothetical protein [Neptunitalea sp. Y10]GLB48549.1 hypothetical protein Y10_09170 [Neptunitalea sp. Y10]
MSLQEIRNNYQRFSNTKLLRIAENDAKELPDEVIEILKSEITRRKLGDHLIQAIDIVRKPITEEDYKAYYELLSKMPCPYCNSKTAKNNVTMVRKTTSAIIITHRTNKPKIGCSNCLDGLHRSANIHTFFLGWWGIPWGPIHSLRTFYKNRKMRKRFNHSNQLDELFVAFIQANIVALESNKQNEIALGNVIRQLNS